MDALISEGGCELFSGYLIRFQTHLEEQSYSKDTADYYLRLVRKLGEIMAASGIELEKLTVEMAAGLVPRLDLPVRRQAYAVFIAKRFAEFLSKQGVVKPSAASMAKQIARADLRRDYEAYLRGQRGLSERTIFHCWRFADRFLEFRFGDAGDDLSGIVQDDIIAFLQKLTSRKSPLRDKTPPTHLRNFFQYLFKTARTATNLALSVPRVAQKHGAQLPRHLAPEQVEAIVTAVRVDTPIGRRNHAMVLLLARLGLRAPEVVAMQLNDIDWRAGEIIVRGKGKRHDRIPMPSDVGEALAEYIRRDRVTPSRTLFVNSRSPHAPFHGGQVLNTILKGAFAKSGLKLPARYVGSHVLRHSLATNLVRRGASLPEVADVLRHRSRASTLIYAKLDLEGLRSIAQPWPTVGGA